MSIGGEGPLDRLRAYYDGTLEAAMHPGSWLGRWQDYGPTITTPVGAPPEPGTGALRAVEEQRRVRAVLATLDWRVEHVLRAFFTPAPPTYPAGLEQLGADRVVAAALVPADRLRALVQLAGKGPAFAVALPLEAAPLAALASCEPITIEGAVDAAAPSGHARIEVRGVAGPPSPELARRVGARLVVSTDVRRALSRVASRELRAVQSRVRAVVQRACETYAEAELEAGRSARAARRRNVRSLLGLE